eukprot:TRINITY_DN22694_c4_g1_i1.p1 TRINITY_DN22694_c4_g1~~TRINITY_DN22694_c4_g1_i1.p1  ORF type:complete len:436 (-),score=50.57 TRINITY_DN22694_c4_g1_i1:128-1390(-)
MSIFAPPPRALSPRDMSSRSWQGSGLNSPRSDVSRRSFGGLRRQVSPRQRGNISGGSACTITGGPDLFFTGGPRTWSPRKRSQSPPVSPRSMTPPKPGSSLWAPLPASRYHEVNDAVRSVLRDNQAPGSQRVPPGGRQQPASGEENSLTLTTLGWSSKKCTFPRNNSPGVGDLITGAAPSDDRLSSVAASLVNSSPSERLRRCPHQKSSQHSVAVATLINGSSESQIEDAERLLEEHRKQSGPWLTCGHSEAVGRLLQPDEDIIKEGETSPGVVKPSQIRRIQEQMGRQDGTLPPAPGSKTVFHAELRAKQQEVANSCKEVSLLRRKADALQLRDMDMARAGSNASGTGLGPMGGISRSHISDMNLSTGPRQKQIFRECKAQVADAVAGLFLSNLSPALEALPPPAPKMVVQPPGYAVNG